MSAAMKYSFWGSTVSPPRWPGPKCTKCTAAVRFPAYMLTWMFHCMNRRRTKQRRGRIRLHKPMDCSAESRASEPNYRLFDSLHWFRVKIWSSHLTRLTATTALPRLPRHKPATSTPPPLLLKIPNTCQVCKFNSDLKRSGAVSGLSRCSELSVVIDSTWGAFWSNYLDVLYNL